MTMIDETTVHSYRSRFPIFNQKRYLNSCSLGPLSTASREGLTEYANHWEENGAPAWWLEWIPRIQHIKGLFSRLVSAPPDAITIHHSISSALSTISSCVDYSRRNRVVVSELDFPTITYQWLARRGVEVVFARSGDGITIPLEEYQRLVDDRTALVATSHVFYATGARQDVSEIGAIAHAHGALVVVDGYHATGVIPVDVQALGVDFYVSGTLKWLCGGPGLTFIYAREQAISQLQPEATGWFASKDQFAFNPLALEGAPSADRLQMGTPAIATVYSGIPGLEMILEADPEAICDRVGMLTDNIVRAAQKHGFELASPSKREDRAGIIMLRAEDPQSAVDHLAEHSIVVDCRPGKIRLSPHFYNTAEDVDAAIECLLDSLPVRSA